MAFWLGIINALRSKAVPWPLLILGAMIFHAMCFCIWRLYFHPLSKYPGPLLGRLSNFYGAYHCWKGDIHHDMHRCHAKYGKIVRYAPNKILFNSAEGVRDIYGNRSNVSKSRAYDQMVHRAANILTLRDKAKHGFRRRTVGSGLSESALKICEPVIVDRVRKLCRVICASRKEGQEWSEVFNMSRLCDYLAFDIMTAIVFSGDYNTLEQPHQRKVIQAIVDSNVRISVLTHAEKLRFGRLDKRLFPRAIAGRNTFIRFVGKVVRDRLVPEKAGAQDIFKLLQEAKDPDTNNRLGLAELSGESATLIIAGTDTSSTTMAAMLFYLSRYPETYRTVIREVRQTFHSLDEVRAGAQLNSCEYLQACITETLRLSPPAGSSLWREVNTGGAIIDGECIPAGVDVGTGIYSLHHNPAYYSDPYCFRPERWLKNGNQGTDPHAAASASAMGAGGKGAVAYMPFSVGPRSCIGKNLALMEVRLMMAMLMWQLDFHDENRDDAGCMEPTGEKEFRLLDHVTGAKDGPMLRFRVPEGVA